MSLYTSGKVHHDPEPWRLSLNSGTTYRAAERERLDYDYDPRPEFDNHNPILATIRLTSSIEPVSWLDTPLLRGELPMAAYTPEHIDHARRVLSKLAALTMTPNGVTD